MKANLYIANISFFYRDDLTSQDLTSELKGLSITIKDIKNHGVRFPEDSDIISLCYELYNHEFINGQTLTDLLYSKDLKTIPRDVKSVLQSMFVKLKKTEKTSQDVLDSLNNNNAHSLNGLLCSNETLINNSNIVKDNSLLINTTQNWYHFHRTFLEQNYTDETYFFNELPKYYENIYFHSNVEHTLKTLKGGLNNFIKQISLNLMYLNDYFNSVFEKYALPEALSRFSTMYPITATLEGNMARKKDLSFDFLNSTSKTKKSIYCEPHLKLKTNDNPGNKHRYNNRIYFHCGIPEIEDGKILVGYIGSHP